MAQRRLLSILLIILVYQVAGQNFEIATYYDFEKTELKEIISLSKKDSSLNGPYKSFHQNGSPHIEGFYKMGKADKHWIYFFENGKKRVEGHFVLGVQSGWWIYYYERGSIKAEGELGEGRKLGFWTNYFENSTPKSSGNYYLNRKEGTWNYYYEDGTLKGQAYFINGKGRYKEFFPSNELKAEGEIENDKSVGIWKYFYQTGPLQATGEFRNGKRHGVWEFFYESNQKLAVGTYENGEKTDDWTYYYEDGKVSQTGSLRKGDEEGIWNLFYPSGEVKSTIHYTQGSGEYLEYFENGAVKTEGIMVKGKRDGVWIFYKQDGSKDGEATYENDIGEFTGYYPNGVVKIRGKLEGEKKIDNWTLYNIDGSIAGVYYPVYEEDDPVFVPQYYEEEVVEREPAQKPEYIFLGGRIRYFDPRINEYSAFIFSINPISPFNKKLPLSIEYYIQERLGFELMYIWQSKPFFVQDKSVPRNRAYYRGGDLKFRNKFYHQDGKRGMFYFGHEINLRWINHKSNVLDSTSISFKQIEIKANETAISYGLYIGWKWMEDAGATGLTFDGYLGTDIGYRSYERLYLPNENYDKIFQTVDKSKLYLPLIFGVNIGWAGPKRNLRGK